MVVEDALVGEAGLLALVLLGVAVMHAGEQVAGVGAEHVVGQHALAAEGLAGGEGVAEQEAGEAVVVGGEREVSATLRLLVGEERGDGLAGLLGLAEAQQHLGLVAPRPDGPLALDGDALLGVADVLGLVGERGRRLAETLGGVAEALGGLGGPGRGGGRRLDALPAFGEAGVVEDEGEFGELLLPGERRQLLERLVEVLRRAVHETQGEAVAGRVGVLVAGVLGEVIAEAVGGEGVVLLVVGALGPGEEHGRLLLGGHLGTGRCGEEGGEGGDETEAKRER